ncbi:hypothetical protein CEUSTIGMA_g10747.t1 [Chlamydomonas eustigma]|uniref:Uncharacterized protein n=1 Tax=Chlamydomonas eustigma TaxID=1157962 RepID=A0A250XJQ5_9CHLO|nr:hypothetical protein CEUSTIGMA_g10747.t1 [Chlamydomonas eustigma]|eukprot:GAX83321.1 hypothetical protein CEUSTIGMA_g10747.t1 [Chlamydomonas eustigma]
MAESSMQKRTVSMAERPTDPSSKKGTHLASRLLSYKLPTDGWVIKVCGNKAYKYQHQEIGEFTSLTKAVDAAFVVHNHLDPTVKDPRGIRSGISKKRLNTSAPEQTSKKHRLLSAGSKQALEHIKRSTWKLPPEWSQFQSRQKSITNEAAKIVDVLLVDVEEWKNLDVDQESWKIPGIMNTGLKCLERSTLVLDKKTKDILVLFATGEGLDVIFPESSDWSILLSDTYDILSENMRPSTRPGIFMFGARKAQYAKQSKYLQAGYYTTKSPAKADLLYKDPALLQTVYASTASIGAAERAFSASAAEVREKHMKKCQVQSIVPRINGAANHAVSTGVSCNYGVENTCKLHTDEGQLEVIALCKKHADQPGQHLFVVADAGVICDLKDQKSFIMVPSYLRHGTLLDACAESQKRIGQVSLSFHDGIDKSLVDLCIT